MIFPVMVFRIRFMKITARNVAVSTLDGRMKVRPIRLTPEGGPPA